MPPTPADAAAIVKAFVPVFRMAARHEAIELLQRSRAVTEALIAGLSAEQVTSTHLGEGPWSIKDLVGHLTTWEEVALVRLGARRPPAGWPAGPASVDDFNAATVELKRDWTWPDVERESVAVRTELLKAISGLSDERWVEKVAAGKGKSALAIVVGRNLSGGRFGYFAHDLAHYTQLKRALS